MNRCVEALKLWAEKTTQFKEAQKAREMGMAALKPYIDLQDIFDKGKIKKKPCLIMASYKPTGNFLRRRKWGNWENGERELIAYLPTLDKFIPFPLASLMTSASSDSDSTPLKLLGIEGVYESIQECALVHRRYPNDFRAMVMASSGGLVCSVLRGSPLPLDEEYGSRDLVLFNPLTAQIVRREALSPDTRPLSISILQVRDHASSSSGRCRLFVALMSERQFIPSCQIYDVEARTWRRFYVYKEWNYITDHVFDYDDEDLQYEDPEMIVWKDAGGQDDDDLRDAHFLLYGWQEDDKHHGWALMGYNVTTDSWMKAFVAPPNEDLANNQPVWDHASRNWTGLFEVWSWKGRVFLASSFRPDGSGKLVPSKYNSSTATASGFDVWELKVRSDESKANKMRSYFWDHISRTPSEFLSEMDKKQPGYYADEFFSTSGSLVWMTAVDFKYNREPFGCYAPHLVYDIECDEWSQVPQPLKYSERKLGGFLPLFMYEPSLAMSW